MSNGNTTVTAFPACHAETSPQKIGDTMPHDAVDKGLPADGTGAGDAVDSAPGAGMHRGQPGWRTQIALGAVWSAMTLGGILYVATYASSVPRHDYWEVVPQVTAHAPLAWQWLWAPHNEHRMPLPKLVLVFLAQWTHDTRTAAWVSLALASLASLMLMRHAARLRGAPSWTDGMYPVILLHVGHATTFLWPFLVCNALPTAISLGLIACMTSHPRPLRSTWHTLACGASIVALPLCGMSGVLFLTPCLLWGLLAAGRNLRSGGEARRNAVFLTLLLAVGAGFVAAVLTTHQGPPVVGPDKGLVAVARTGGQCLAVGFGTGVAYGMPLEAAGDYAWIGVALLVIVCVGACAWGLAKRWMTSVPDRPCCEGLLAALVGMLLIAAGIALGRASLGADAGLQDRYAMVLAPLPIALGLSAAAFGGWTGRVISWILCVLALALLPCNLWFGLGNGLFHRRVLGPVERHLSQGFPPSLVAALHQPSLWPGPREVFTARLEMLQDARMLPRVRVPPQDLAVAVNACGVALAKHGRLEQAAQLFEKALELDARSASARQNLLTVRRALAERDPTTH